MKRFIIALCAGVFCLALAGCSAGAGTATNAASTTSGATASSASDSASVVVADGVYPIQIETDSSMVNVVEGLLTVRDGAYTVSMSLNGEGFSRLYEGSAEEAAQAADADIYDYRLNEAGKYTFDFPVQALDEETDIALFGQRRDTWYDHALVFHAPTEPALSGQASSAARADAGAPAGDYRIAVTLQGGSGKASVESPAALSVAADGSMTATIVWSSPNYDQMVVDGVQYLPVNSSGNSTFQIPVSALDADLAVQAETTAMSEPHMIDYTLRFDSSTLT